jgi:hypothetical protein
MSINKKPAIIKKLLALQPKAIRCLELCPEAFSDQNNENDIIKELKTNKRILEI